MLTITVPFKTPLGHEELRSRAHKLGQRHRTLLFLIDGRRPLAEVLSLAHQAGAATSHFEDLLRMGLVELPPDPTPQQPPSFDIPTLTDEASLTSVDMVVLQEVVQRTEPTVVLPAEPPPPVHVDAPPVPQAEAPTEVHAEAPTEVHTEERVERRRVDLPIDPTRERRTHWRTSTSAPLDQPETARPALPAQRVLPVLSVELEPELLAPLPPLPPSIEDEPDPAPARRPKPAKVRFKAGSIPVLNDTPEDPFERTMRQLPVYVPATDPEPPFERTSRQFGPQEPDSPPDHATIPAVTQPVEPPVVRVESFKPRTSTPSRRVVLDDSLDAAPPFRSSADRAADAVDAADAAAIDLVLPLPDIEEARFLQEIRDLLTDALRLDAPLFSARTFMRVRGAQSASQLIQLVWEIEIHLSHRRRSRREMISLQKARELLGLGNTVVAGDDSRSDDVEE